jgi:Protein of unknown function (DUF1761)
MAPFNWLPIFAAAIIPLLIGMIYYSNFAFGKMWRQTIGMTEAEDKSFNMAKVFGLTLFFGLFLSIFILPVVLHGMHVFSLISPAGGGAPDPNSPEMKDALEYFGKYGGNFRTFRHGVLHGVIAALLGIWPVIAINALFERRGWKYVAIHVGYWVITFALMGGVICAFGLK